MLRIILVAVAAVVAVAGMVVVAGHTPADCRDTMVTVGTQTYLATSC